MINKHYPLSKLTIALILFCSVSFTQNNIKDRRQQVNPFPAGDVKLLQWSF